MKRLLTLSLIIVIQCGIAQNTYFVSFKDKGDISQLIAKPEQFLSPKAIERRHKYNISIDIYDVPVKTEYIDAVSLNGGSVKYQSKWGNGVITVIQDSDTNQIHQLPIVRDLKLIKRGGSMSPLMEKSKLELPEVAADYGDATSHIEMINANELNDNGYTGLDKIIAVLDAGYRGVNTLPHFSDLISKNQIISTWNFADENPDVYIHSDHGTSVLSLMAAKDGNNPFGIAPDAKYALFITEDRDGENRIEEYYWMIGAEKADSLGADIINSSLVYYDFDIAEHNYYKSDLDGNTAVITKAADRAANKGILVVNSAGNEGNSSWGTIAFPADADSILTVGSVDANKQFSSFSSYGPTADNRIKPDMSAQGGGTYIVPFDGNIRKSSGTSLSSPIIAAFAACIWQEKPELNNMELIEYLKSISSNRATPNSQIGHGIPYYKKEKNESDVIANFKADKYKINEGEVINFTDISFNNPESWNWEFEGGDPALSTDQNPIVFYTAPGEYKVTLIVNNINGSDTKSIEGYIKVSNTGKSCDAEDYDSNKAYSAGDHVAYNGMEYQAKWWTKGDDPSSTGNSGVWEVVGPCLITSINISKNRSFNSYPNPFKTEAILVNSSFDNVPIEVFDINGRVVESFTVEATQKKVFGTNLKPGVYFVRFLINEKTRIERIVKY